MCQHLRVNRRQALLLGTVVALALVMGFLACDAGLDPLVWIPILLTVMFLVYRAFDASSATQSAPVPLRPRLGSSAREPALPADHIRIDALADPSIVVSADWRVLSANRGALDLFGQRIVGADLRQTVRHPVVLDAVRLAIQGQAPSPREVTTLGARDGAFRVRVVEVEDRRLLLTFADVTQTRLTERMRVDFVANASHELRTPLANITGFIETLLGPASEDEPARRRFLEIMGGEAGRMSRLIDDLLSLSRIELDKYVRPQTMLDLPPLLSDVGKTLAMRLEGDGRKLMLEVEHDLPQVVADRDQILQVLHNLVSNALKYGRHGTPITLSAVREPVNRGEEMVRVSVRDEGDGIAPEHIPRLTERFYRIDTGRSRTMGGTGLGLAIVKHIVERHRGQLDIHSRQGEGTTIAFLLPTHPPTSRPAETDASAASPEGASQNRNESVT